MKYIQWAFGCGIDDRELKTKYESLSEEDRLRLERVARRINLILTLRYRVSIHTSPFERYSHFDLVYFELPSTQIYLLCTCLDILAGQPDHKNFKAWIEEQPDINYLGKDGIKQLYSQYEGEYAVGRNLRNLFRDLPQGAKDWLARNVVIRRANQPLAPERQKVKKLLDRLYLYFYNHRRNSFTHSGVSHITPISDDIREPTDEGWWVTPASGTHVDLYKDDKKWNFSYREGLDEITILRIIIYADVLKKLKIELTSELIDTNVRSYSRLHALYNFLGEINRNSALANLWTRIVDDPRMSDQRLDLIHSGFSLLSSEASTIMVERYRDNRRETALRQMTSRYVKEVDHINSLVSDFNESNPPVRNADEQNKQWQVVKEFLDKLVDTPIFKSVVNLPSEKIMADLWLVISDPCYTPNTMERKMVQVRVWDRTQEKWELAEVASDQILAALAWYDSQYPKKDYKPRGRKTWLEDGRYKYAIKYRGHFYPPKYILRRVIGAARDFYGGGKAKDYTNAVLKELGFVIIQKPSG